MKVQSGRLTLAGALVSMALVALVVPQTVRLSGGTLPNATVTDIVCIVMAAVPAQTTFKLTQYLALRWLKMALDDSALLPPTLNTIFSYGFTATIMQSAAYNHAIAKTYHYYSTRTNRYDLKKKAPAAATVQRQQRNSQPQLQSEAESFTSAALYTIAWNFVQAKILPGVVFSFARECLATGTGITLGPLIQDVMGSYISNWPPMLAKITCGIIAGALCSLLTQWLHNNALRAGILYTQTGYRHNLIAVLRATWQDLGMRMFIVNANKRVLSTATATTVLSVVNVFSK